MGALFNPSLHRSIGQSTGSLYFAGLSRYLRPRVMRFSCPRLLSTAFAASLVIAPSLAQAQCARTLELSSLNGTNGFVINGIHIADNNGWSVSGAGDVNADGIDDFIIGAPEASPIEELLQDAGQSYVVFGRSDGFPASFDLRSLDGTNGFQINGVRQGNSGTSVSGAGDVNGDGIADLIVGSPNGFIFDEFNEYIGISYVVFGSNNGFPPLLELNSLNGTNGFSIGGLNIDEAGTTVSGAGDINGDGLDDLIIGTREIFDNGNLDFVVFGRNNFPSFVNLNSLNGDDGFLITRGGASVSGAGDINDDGIDDLIVGAVLADPNGRTNAGQSYIVFGRESFSPSINLSSLDGADGFVINGINVRDRSGFSVSEAGDVNGDDIDDLIIGTSGIGQSYVVFGSSNGFSGSFELSSLDGSNGFQINESGSSVSGAGDVNGDGIDDLIIGEPFANPNGRRSAGQSYVLFGNSGGFSPSLTLSALDGTNGFQINGIEPSDTIGFSVSGAGDINGDGFDDVIIGAPSQLSFLLPPDFSPGKSYVVYGRASAPEPLIGDVNQNGVVNFLDIAPFISVLSSNHFIEEADINDDGVVSFIDIGPFINLLSSQQ